MTPDEEERGTFPAGSGVAQGGVGIKGPVEGDGAINPAAQPGVSRPQPTDPGGTNNSGWMKTADYGDGYYGGDSGRFRQV
jgi:hypothetical protein